MANAVLRAPSCVPLRPHTCNLTTTHQLKVNTVLSVLDLDGNDVPLSFGEDAAELLEQGDGQAGGGAAITRLCFRPSNAANLAGLTQAKLRVQQVIAARN